MRVQPPTNSNSAIHFRTRPTRDLSWTLVALLALGGLTSLSCGIKISDGNPDSPTPALTSPLPEVTPSPTPPLDPIYEGSFTVEPDALRFGDVPTGTSVRKDVYFKNESGDKVYITSYTTNSTFPCFVGDYIKVCDWDMEGDTPPPMPEFLLPGETMGFCVKFNPTQTGNFKGAFTIFSDHGNPSIPLTGTGVSPDQALFF